MARTNTGSELKVHAALLVLICTNVSEQSRYDIMEGFVKGERSMATITLEERVVILEQELLALKQQLQF